VSCRHSGDRGLWSEKLLDTNEDHRGDYGREQYSLGSDNEIDVSRKFKLPVIRDLAVQYAFDESIELEACLSYNNLDLKTSPFRQRPRVSPSVRTFRFRTVRRHSTSASRSNSPEDRYASSSMQSSFTMRKKASPRSSGASATDKAGRYSIILMKRKHSSSRASSNLSVLPVCSSNYLRCKPLLAEGRSYKG